MFESVFKVCACKDQSWERKCEIWAHSKVAHIEKDQEKE